MKRTALRRRSEVKRALPAWVTNAPYTLEGATPRPTTKRSVLKRKAKALKRSTRIRPVGKRGAADREAIERVRQVVLARAGQRCERCWGRGRLELHHRLPRSRGGTHEASNLVALCRVCHRAVHAGAADAHRWIETRKGAA